MILKVKSTKALKVILEREHRDGKRIVFTNGCFDILHLGHIRYLKNAKALGDILVVGLNSDSSVRAIKGLFRPINTQKDRAEVLSSLYFVDYITIFTEYTPERLIKRLRPDILVKGGDWKVKDIVGADFVKGHGGKVVTVPFVKGYSTSSLIARSSKKGKEIL